MLRMQVPDGQPKAGMVHHKIHDKEWTALGIAPRRGRAAALPLAALHGGDAEPGGDGGAVRAHLGRSWTRRSRTRCLAAAEKAWAAAEREPGRLRAARRRSAAGPYDDTRRQRRVLLGGRRALRRRRRRTSTRRSLEKSPHYKKVPIADRRRQLPDADDLGIGRGARDDHAGAGAERAARRGRSTTARRRSRRRPTATSRWSTRQGYRVPFKPGKKGYPVGLELVRAQQRASSWRWRTTSRGDAKYLERGRRGDELHPRAQPARPVVRHRLRRAPAREPAPPLLGAPGERQVPVGAAGRRVGRAELGPAGSLRAGGRAWPAARPQKCFVDNIEAWSATRSRSTGTRRSPGWRRSSTRRRRAPAARAPARRRARSSHAGREPERWRGLDLLGFALMAGTPRARAAGVTRPKKHDYHPDYPPGRALSPRQRQAVGSDGVCVGGRLGRAQLRLR